MSSLETAEKDVRELKADEIVALAQVGFDPTEIDKTRTLDKESVFHFRYELLRRLAREGEHLLWQVIRDDHHRDRHEIVWALWEILKSDPLLKQHHHSVVGHRRIMFGWFVEHYDVPRARAIYASGWPVRHFHWFLLALLLANLFTLSAWWLALLSYGISCMLFLVKGRPSQISPIESVQSLVPRLAGAVAVGYLFLVASDSFTKYLSEQSRWRVGSACLGIAALYLVLEMGHRLRPMPRLGVVLSRALDTLCIGACHAIALVIISSRFLSTIVDGQVSMSLSLVWAAVVLLIGLVLNVFWAEEPVTRPL
ncbi:MAG: hypothetical protein HYX75_25620 [Acidobacteria bacterium]|nr:hypothetical protein [Acidobacteriota bacterium]